jgi:hypothetical protein
MNTARQSSNEVRLNRSAFNPFCIFHAGVQKILYDAVTELLCSLNLQLQIYRTL